ncbi:MAG: hypothetical protein ACF8R9_11505 [Phycisphaerales bacterium JB054]
MRAHGVCAIPLEIEAMKSSESVVRERVLREVVALVERGLPDDALKLLKSANGADPVLMNAAGVCHLRAGRPDRAVEVFRRLCVGEGIGIRPDANQLHVANFATALLLSGNLNACRHHLRLVDPRHPVAAQVSGAIAGWEASLGGWQRLLRRVGMYEPKRPLELGSPPGSFA